MPRHFVIGALCIGMMHGSADVSRARGDDDRGEPVKLPFYSLVDSGLIWLLTKPGVQKELGLDESESKKLLKSLREIDPTRIELQTPEERRQRVAALKAIRDETAKRSEDAIQSSLSEAQFQRFQQLKLQQIGSRALLLPEAARELALTDEQREKLKAISQEYGARNPAEVSEKFKADLLTVLTPEQVTRWKEMTGIPFTAPKSFAGVPWQLILVTDVHKELGLSGEDATALVQSLTAIRKEVTKERGQEAFGSNRANDPVVGRMRQFQQMIDTVRSSLTASQWNRLQELILQDAGVESLEHPEVAKKLSLSRDQRDRVRESIGPYRDRQIARDRRRNVRPAERPDLLDILTADQKAEWDSMQGVKLDTRALDDSSNSTAE